MKFHCLLLTIPVFYTKYYNKQNFQDKDQEQYPYFENERNFKNVTLEKAHKKLFRLENNLFLNITF